MSNKKMITLNIKLTVEEADYLMNEMNMILRQFSKHPYNGKQFTNPDMGSAFNKVFKELSGRDHENCTPDKFEEMRRYHESA